MVAVATEGTHRPRHCSGRESRTVSRGLLRTVTGPVSGGGYPHQCGHLRLCLWQRAAHVCLRLRAHRPPHQSPRRLPPAGFPGVDSPLALAAHLAVLTARGGLGVHTRRIADAGCAMADHARDTLLPTTLARIPVRPWRAGKSSTNLVARQHAPNTSAISRGWAPLSPNMAPIRGCWISPSSSAATNLVLRKRRLHYGSYQSGAATEEFDLSVTAAGLPLSVPAAGDACNEFLLGKPPGDGPKDRREGMTQTVQKNIRVTPAQWERLEAATEGRELSANQLAIEALDRLPAPIRKYRNPSGVKLSFSSTACSSNTFHKTLLRLLPRTSQPGAGAAITLCLRVSADDHARTTQVSEPQGTYLDGTGWAMIDTDLVAYESPLCQLNAAKRRSRPTTNHPEILQLQTGGSDTTPRR